MVRKLEMIEWRIDSYIAPDDGQAYAELVSSYQKIAAGYWIEGVESEEEKKKREEEARRARLEAIETATNLLVGRTSFTTLGEESWVREEAELDAAFLIDLDIAKALRGTPGEERSLAVSSKSKNAWASKFEDRVAGEIAWRWGRDTSPEIIKALRGALPNATQDEKATLQARIDLCTQETLDRDKKYGDGTLDMETAKRLTTKNVHEHFVDVAQQAARLRPETLKKVQNKLAGEYSHPDNVVIDENLVGEMRTALLTLTAKFNAAKGAFERHIPTKVDRETEVRGGYSAFKPDLPHNALREARQHGHTMRGAGGVTDGTQISPERPAQFSHGNVARSRNRAPVHRARESHKILS